MSQSGRPIQRIAQPKPANSPEADVQDMILVIDDDPETRMLLREQVFAARNFRVIEAKNGSEVLPLLRDHRPDLIVLDLQLPDLSGNDVLVAIQSQGYRGPLIVVADNGAERNAIGAFRLGATDFVVRPIREAEVMAAVERGLAEVRLRRQRDRLMTQIQTTNQQLEARVNELTTLYDIGQSVASMHDLEALFSRVLDGAVSVTKADHAMLLLRDDKGGQVILKAGKNLRLSMLDRLGEVVQDQLADLVMTSREVLSVSGDGLRRFASARDLYAVVYVPLTMQTTAIGALAVGNHETQRAFSENHGRLLKALADYAAVAIVNARLIGMLNQRAQAMENAYRELRDRDAQRGRQLQVVLARLQQPLAEIESEIGGLVQGTEGRLPQKLNERLAGIVQKLKQLEVMVSNLSQQK